MEKNNGVPFRLLGLKTVQYAVFDSVEVEQDKIDLETGILFGLDADKYVVGVGTRFTFHSGNQPFLLIELRCEFNIEDEAWRSFQVDSNKIAFPKVLMEHLTTITVGSCRGALHAKTEGTIYNQYLIPTINLTEFIKKDVEFNLDNLEKLQD